MKNYLSLIKFSHTIFALPFALLGFFMALQETEESFTLWTFILVVLCMVFGRSAAMAFNRYADRDIDATNERTRLREIPAGVIAPRNALLFVVINVILFMICAGLINPLCLALSPLALLVVLGYSYTKRFTYLSHVILGMGLAIAPVGAYIAVTEHFDLLPILYGGVVLLWVSGFDIIYALQDEDFDSASNLHSIPSHFGAKKALTISAILHVACAVLMICASYLLALNYPSLLVIHWIGAAIFLGLLLYQHFLVRPDDLSRVNLAFFTMNGVASLVFGCLVILDFYV